jgi:hypothetical protein
VFTCDRGRRWLDVDRDSSRTVAGVLQELVESSFWRELDRFPTDVMRRHLPNLSLSRSMRRLLEIWIEEKEAQRVA